MRVKSGKSVPTRSGSKTRLATSKSATKQQPSIVPPMYTRPVPCPRRTLAQTAKALIRISDFAEVETSFGILGGLEILHFDLGFPGFGCWSFRFHVLRF